MKLVVKPLTKNELKDITDKYGHYVKVTVDIEKKILVVGPRLHADGEKILLEEQNSQQDDIWGGGISLSTKEIDATAVLNIRPLLDNPSIEILDPERRKKILEIIRNLFTELWN